MAVFGSAPLPKELSDADSTVKSLCAAFLTQAQALISRDSTCTDPLGDVSEDVGCNQQGDRTADTLRELAKEVRHLSQAIKLQNFSSKELDELRRTNESRQLALKGLLESLDGLIDSSWRSVISYHESNPSQPREVSPNELVAYASRLRSSIFDGMGVLPSQPPAPQMWHMQNSAWSNYTNTLLSQAADEYKSASSKKEPAAAQQPTVTPAVPSPLASIAIPPDWKPGDALPISMPIPASWKPGDPLPPVPIPPGWQPGDPLPIPGWKPGDPIPPLPFPPGWKMGDPIAPASDNWPVVARPAQNDGKQEPGEVPSLPAPNPNLEIDWLLDAEEASEEDYSDDME